MKKIFLFLGFVLLNSFVIYAQAPYWQQVGMDINGVAAQKREGFAVSMSANGLVMATGSPYDCTVNPCNLANIVGHVRVFEWNGNVWVQRGPDMLGDTSGQFGASVSLSDDGTRIAITNPGYIDPVLGQVGYVRVLEWNGTSWVQIGNDIVGTTYFEALGAGVSLSADGLTLGVSSGGGPSGLYTYLKIFFWNGSSWVPKGSTISFPTPPAGGIFAAVTLNGAGDRIMVGDVWYGYGYGIGQARMYHWDGVNWVFKVNWIGNPGSHLGNSVALSSDGNTAIVGADGADIINTYRWNGSSWLQLGLGIPGEAAGDRPGYGVSINSNGNRIAIGAIQNSGNGTYSGHVRIYDWNGTAWNQTGQDIDGEYAGDNLGFSVSLSDSANYIAIGAPRNSDNGFESGHVRVFKLAVPPPCQTNLTITANPYIVPYTESSNWIHTSGYVTIPMATYVNLDVDSTGHISLAPGFKAEYGSVFVAEAYNGCGTGAPLLPMQKINSLDEKVCICIDGLKIYPNPSTGIFNIEHDNLPHEIVVYDLKGTKLFTVQTNGKTNSQIDLSHFSKGIYVIRFDGIRNVKILKE